MRSLKRKTHCLAGVFLCSGLFIAAAVEAIEISNLVVIDGAARKPSVLLMSGDIPMGQSAGDKESLLPEDVSSSDDDLFGGQGGFVHFNATAQGVYTTNVYNTDLGKKSSWIMSLSPVVWVAVPRKKDIPISLTPNNTSAGGQSQAMKEYEGTDRYQAYGMGGLDFITYSEDDHLNTINGLGEGMIRYNRASGLSLMLVDRYTHSSDRFDVGSEQGINENKFDSNIVIGTADWTMTEKLRAKIDYSNFFLDYDKEIDAFKERSDNTFDISAYFKYSLKTSFFVQGRFVDVAYVTATFNDNQQYFVYGGIKWDTTEKVSLMAKAGYQEKGYDNNDATLAKRGDYTGLAFDVQAVYKVTDKTKLTLDMYRANEETDSTVATDKTVFGAKFGYNQKFTEKISGSLSAGYEDAEYSQLIEQDRDDASFRISPAAQYLFKEWLQAEVSYQYEQRDSTDDLFDFTTNIFMANVKVAF